MPTIFLTLIAVLAVTLTLLLSGNLRTDPRGFGLGMVTGGLGLIAFAVVAALVTGQALAAVPAGAGVAFIALGAWRLRSGR
jgi:hypothetical protein